MTWIDVACGVAVGVYLCVMVLCIRDNLQGKP